MAIMYDEADHDGMLFTLVSRPTERRPRLGKQIGRLTAAIIETAASGQSVMIRATPDGLLAIRNRLTSRGRTLAKLGFKLHTSAAADDCAVYAWATPLAKGRD